MSSRLASFVMLAASIGGRSLHAQMMEDPRQPFSAAQQFADGIPQAEDSSENRANNMIFYNNPRGMPATPVAAPAATVSVEQLQHPISRKAAKILAQARNFADMGRHDKAIEQLQAALKERSAVPYAHSMLGIEYLRTQRVPDALAELEQAVELLPHNIPNRSNLGYALFLSGDLQRAETETRQALDLDRNNAKTQFVLNEILRVRKTQAPALP